MSFLSQFTSYSFPTLGLVRLPTVKISDEDKKSVGLNHKSTNTSYFKMICWNAYRAKAENGTFGSFTEQQVKDRLRMEFEVFEKTGIIDYLLLVWDILKWCDDQGIIRGKGRGSAAGSLALYLSGITDINPLRHNLNFTRFLSEARAKPKVIDGITYADGKNLCDIDSDISFIDRPRVIEYVEQKHHGKTCKISTRLQLTGKTALKDVLKAYLEYDESQAKHITDYIESQFGNVEDLAKALEKRKDLKAWVDEKPIHQKAFDIARALEGLNVAKGQHPSGLFISYYDLDGNVPVELSKDGDPATAYDMNVAATLAVKIDILGLRTLDVIAETCRHAKISVDDIDINDPSIYDYLRRTDLYGGLFQIEDGLTKQALHKIGPRHINDLAACLSISRPGALIYIPDYVKFVREGVINKVYPAIDEILSETGGILIYQEQINRICQEVCGLPATEADDVRRAIGKKLKEEMQKWEPILYTKGRERAVPDDIIKWFWDICNASGDYLFNASHAYSYGYITAYTTYLKANHPREFTLALLKMSKHEPKSQQVLMGVISEAKQLGVAVLPPDILKSGDDFSVEETGVRFGLSHIRGISDANMTKLMSFRRDFTSTFDIFNAAQEAKISISVLFGLIMCGCVGAKSGSRAKLALEAQTYNLLTPRETLLVRKLGAEYNDDLLTIIKALGQKTDEKGKPYIKESRLATLRRDYEPYERMYRENSRNEELTSFICERHFLGFSYSSTLRAIYGKKVEGLMSISEVMIEEPNIKVRFVGFVDEVKKATSAKSKKPYVKYTISDETGSIKVMLHGEPAIETVTQFHGELPSEGDIVIISGSKASGDMVFCGAGTRRDESFIRQTNPIKIKKGDLTLDI